MRRNCFSSLTTHSTATWDAVWMTIYGKRKMFLVNHFQAVWYRVGGNEVISIVLVWDPDRAFPNTVLFDTDALTTTEQIIERFAYRWSIEITNRETKSLLGSSDPQCRCEQSVTRAPRPAYWSNCLVVTWFVLQVQNGKVSCSKERLCIARETSPFQTCWRRLGVVISPLEFWSNMGLDSTKQN